MKQQSDETYHRAVMNHDHVLTNYDNETFTKAPLRYLDGKSMRKWGSGWCEYDGHRQKLYRAEHASYQGKGESFKDLDGVRRYLDYVTDLKSFQRRFKVDSDDIVVELKQANAKRSSARFGRYGHRLFFSPDRGLKESVVLHELAHLLSPPPHAPHGRLFASVLLWLVKSRMNMRSELLEEFRDRGVPYSPHRSIQIPEPDNDPIKV